MLKLLKDFISPIIYSILVISHFITWFFLPISHNTTKLTFGYNFSLFILPFMYFSLYLDLHNTIKKSNKVSIINNMKLLKKYIAWIMYGNLILIIYYIYFSKNLSEYFQLLCQLIFIIVCLIILLLQLDLARNYQYFNKSSNKLIWYKYSTNINLKYYQYFFRNLQPINIHEVVTIKSNLKKENTEALKLLKYISTTPSHHNFFIVNIQTLTKLFLWIGSIGLIATVIDIKEIKNMTMSTLDWKVILGLIILFLLFSITNLLRQRRNQIDTLLPNIIDDVIEEKKEKNEQNEKKQ